MSSGTVRSSGKGFEIRVRNEFPHPGVSEKKLIKVSGKILHDLGFKNAVVSILLVGGRRMRSLNQRYLKHAWSTDVLAFGQGKITKTARSSKNERGSPETEPARVKKPVRPGEMEDFLGDIALCVPTIEDQAEEYGHAFEEELDYCLCHGILHLLGHKDKTRTERKRMHRKQRQLLKHIAPKS